MITTVDLRGNTRVIKSCSLKDVNKHFSAISHIITDKEEAKLHKERMKECVNEGTAFAMDDDCCFLYYKKSDDKAFATGVALQGTGYPLQTMALFYGIFDQLDKETLFIRMKLHENKTINEYKSILTSTSIKNHKTINDPVLIKVHDFLKKVRKVKNRKNKNG